MDFFKRIGTNRHKFKVQFFLNKLTSNAKLKGDVYITIRRGDHKLTTQEKRNFGSNFVCDFKNQILTFDALTLFYDEDEKKYQEKLGEIKVVIKNQKGEKKLLGIIEFDVGQLANKKVEKISQTKKLSETSKKIQMNLQYEIYIKFIGQSSEISKQAQPKKRSQSKVERKREGSLLDKIGNFFSFDDPKEQQQEQVKEPQRKKSKQKTKEEVKNEKKKIVREEHDRTKRRNIFSDQDEGKQKVSKIKIKQKQEEDDFSENTPKNRKNIPKQKITFTEYEESDPEKSNFKKPSQIRTYRENINEFSLNREDTTNKDTIKDEIDIHSKCELQIKTLKRQKEQYEIELKKVYKQLQLVKQENQTYKKQIKQYLQEKEKLLSEINKLTNQESSSEFLQISPQRQKQLQETIGRLQKDKIETLLKLEELESKAKKEHKKYEELVEKYEEEKIQLNKEMKVQLLKAKDECSQGRSKLQKSIQEIQKKTEEIKQLRKSNKEIEKQLFQTLKNLSNLKMKIGEMVNEATGQNDQNLMQIFTELLRT